MTEATPESAHRRADIDGLRAIAALAITVFHIAPGRAHGGFIGVDVFFVISGFLITGLVWRDLRNSTFSLVEFYARRARRLFPALFVVVVACLVAGWFLLLPSEMSLLGASAASSAAYVSNIVFWTKSGYFDGGLAGDALLHTWSLSVEEQFYLVLPAGLILVAGRFPRAIWPVVGGVALASFAACLWASWNAPTAAFYLAPMRAWEFLAGGALALLPRVPIGPLWRNIVALAGLALLVVCIRQVRESDIFPGWIALLPVAGTVAIIAAGSAGPNVLRWGLSLPPLQWIGRASYSIYLWHWPIIVFYGLAIDPTPGDAAQVALLAASIGAGLLSYWLVEIPTRRLSVGRGGRALLVAAVATLPFILVGTLATLSEGFPSRFTDQQRQLAAYLDEEGETNVSGPCFISSGEVPSDFDAEDCMRHSADKPNVLILGDSHSAQYAQALALVFPEVSVSQISASGCRPLLLGKGVERCTSMMAKAFAAIEANQFDAVILGGRWRKVENPLLRATIDFIAPHARQVVVLGPIIEYEQSLPRLLTIGSKLLMNSARKTAPIRQEDDALARAASGTAARYFSVLDEICPDGDCKVLAAPGVPMQFDYGHLTLEGAQVVVRSLRQRGLLAGI